jgi:hypothetical protein
MPALVGQAQTEKRSVKSHQVDNSKQDGFRCRDKDAKYFIFAGWYLYHDDEKANEELRNRINESGSAKVPIAHADLPDIARSFFPTHCASDIWGAAINHSVIG